MENLLVLVGLQSRGARNQVLSADTVTLANGLQRAFAPAGHNLSANEDVNVRRRP